MEEKRTGFENKKCNIYVDDRKKITVSAVEDIDTFDENCFVAITSEGALTVKGLDLHIIKLNVDVGELIVEGQIDSFEFNDNYKTKTSFFSKVFK